MTLSAVQELYPVMVLVHLVALQLAQQLLLLIQQLPEQILPLKHFLSNLDLVASWQFYLAIFIMYVVLLIGMYGVTRFDYWELSPNEIIHHHGVLGDVERFSTAGLKLNKEIHDIFEYLLAGAGRIILVIPGQLRPVILDNVL